MKLIIDYCQDIDNQIAYFKYVIEELKALNEELKNENERGDK